MERVAAPGVLIEGNSFTDFVPVDFMLMARVPRGKRSKPQHVALCVAPRGLYLSESKRTSFVCGNASVSKATTLDVAADLRRNDSQTGAASTPRRVAIGFADYSRDLPQLVSELRRIRSPTRRGVLAAARLRIVPAEICRQRPV